MRERFADVRSRGSVRSGRRRWFPTSTKCYGSLPSARRAHPAIDADSDDRADNARDRKQPGDQIRLERRRAIPRYGGGRLRRATLSDFIRARCRRQGCRGLRVCDGCGYRAKRERDDRNEGPETSSSLHAGVRTRRISEATVLSRLRVLDDRLDDPTIDAESRTARRRRRGRTPADTHAKAARRVQHVRFDRRTRRTRLRMDVRITARPLGVR